MHDPDIKSLVRAAAERQLAVAALQSKYAQSEGVPTEQLVQDMSELLSTERVVLDAIITLFVKLNLGEDDSGSHLSPLPAEIAKDSAGVSDPLK
jgi:hypothetical protein